MPTQIRVRTRRARRPRYEPFDIGIASGQQRLRTAYQESLRRATAGGRLLSSEEAEGLRRQSAYRKIYKNLEGEPEKQRRLMEVMRKRGIPRPEQWEIEHGAGTGAPAQMPGQRRRPSTIQVPGPRPGTSPVNIIPKTLTPKEMREGGQSLLDLWRNREKYNLTPEETEWLRGKVIKQGTDLARQVRQPETFLPPTWDEKMRREEMLEAQLEDEIRRGRAAEAGRLFEGVAAGGSAAAALPAAGPMLRSALEADAGFQDAVTAFKPWQDIMTDPSKVGLRKDAYSKWKAAKDRVVKERQRVQDELKAEAADTESQEKARATSIAGALETMPPEEQKERLGLLSTEDRALLDKYHPVLSAKAVDDRKQLQADIKTIQGMIDSLMDTDEEGKTISTDPERTKRLTTLRKQLEDRFEAMLMPQEAPPTKQPAPTPISEIPATLEGIGPELNAIYSKASAADQELIAKLLDDGETEENIIKAYKKTKK